MRKLIAAGLFGATLAPARLAAETATAEPREQGGTDTAPKPEADRADKPGSAD